MPTSHTPRAAVATAQSGRSRARPQRPSPFVGIPPRLGFRGDIEGLRALAVTLVLLYHATVPGFSAGFMGVDIFFVISGYLITHQLIKEYSATGRISIADFYARRFRRLMPAATAVLMVTALATAMLAPSTLRRTFGVDITSAAAFVSNWRFADRAVDYLAEDTGPSPVLHFWSLSIEEQFYVFWPVLFLGVTVGATRWLRPRLMLGIALGVVALGSFAVSVALTSSDPALAFFHTGTRVWELSVGAGLAFLAPLLSRLAPPVRLWLLGLGIAGFAYSFITISGATPWPGTHALLPVMSTALVIAAQVNVGWASRVFSNAPAIWIGGISYALYLWHWPVLVIADWVVPDVSTMGKVGVVALAVIPAWASTRFLEAPVRRAQFFTSSTRRSWLLGLTLVGTGALLGIMILAANPQPDRGTPARVEVPPPAISDQGVEETHHLVTEPFAGDPSSDIDNVQPPPAAATEDVPDTYDDNCQVDRATTTPIVCERGDLDGSTAIAVLGDSKANQWTSALDAIGADRGWRFDIITKSACTYTAGRPVGEYDNSQDRYSEYEACTDYNANVTDLVLEGGYTAVLTSAVTSYALTDDGARSVQAGAAGRATAWSHLEDAGIDVLAILDNPYPTGDDPVYQCVADNPETFNKDCAFDTKEGREGSGAPAEVAAAKLEPRATIIDMTPAICADECEAVIDDTLVYRSGSHLTDRFVRELTPSLTPLLDIAITEAARE